jgi:hypothetical protein
MVKLFFIVNLAVLVFCSLAFLYDFEQFSKTIWYLLGCIVLPLELAGLLALKRQRQEALQRSPASMNDSGYHNDFSQVGSGPKTPVKPKDYTGNMHLHHDETYQDDMRNIGIDPHKKSKESDES